MKKTLSYRDTITACFASYIVQAIGNNFAPLLFLTFQNEYQLPLSQITLIVTFNFGIQLLVDLLSTCFADRLGYRMLMILAHVFSALGLTMLAILPEIMPSPFSGILLSVMLYAIGGGIIEVLVSPIVEACPSANKERAMSMLHSFYCWGHAGVVIISTLFFHFAGIGSWHLLAILWALVPAVNAFAFARVPIMPLIAEGHEGLSIRQLLSSRVFWLLLIMMISSGAGEHSVSQWASSLAEQGLGISKTLGDLAGPMAFAILMGLSRAFYGRYGDRISLDRFMKASCLLAIVSYLGISLLPFPALNLVFCALCGLSIGIMWPGTFSKASAAIPGGGTALFALLALGGDIGCTAGPTLVGFASDALGSIKSGILAGIIFPIMLLAGLIMLRKKA